MSSYFLAPALVVLRDQINRDYPKRDKSSDGWIGDTSHAARPSDHNPDWKASGKYRGIVRALDIDVDGNRPGVDLRREILNMTIGDPRVWYVISNGIIYSRTYGWKALKYTGPNGHFKHVHVSLMHMRGEFDSSRWGREKPKFKPQPIRLDVVQKAFRDVATGKKQDRQRAHVRRVQKALNHKYNLNLATDGWVGPATLKAWKQHELLVGGKHRVKVPDAKSLRGLVAPNYNLVVKKKVK